MPVMARLIFRKHLVQWFLTLPFNVMFGVFCMMRHVDHSELLQCPDTLDFKFSQDSGTSRIEHFNPKLYVINCLSIGYIIFLIKSIYKIYLFNSIIIFYEVFKYDLFRKCYFFNYILN